MDFMVFLGIVLIVTFLFATWRICLIAILVRKMFEAQIESQSAILRAQTEVLKATKLQSRLLGQLLKAYGHEPDCGPDE